MLRIAICDDQQEELHKAEKLLKDYFDLRQLTAEMSLFSHPDQLLCACESQNFHIYLLDIVMPMLSGVELGTAIRRNDREAQIIFITTAPEYALSSFASNPLNYLMKPVEPKALYDTLDFAVSKVDYEDDKTIMVKTKAGMKIVAMQMVALCEYSNHRVLYTLKNGEQIQSLSSKMPFFEIVQCLLEDASFLQPHVSFVLNMNCVKSIGKDGFLMNDGRVVPISQKQYTAVRNVFFDHVFGENRGK